jgi:hypothetical protein
MAGEAFGIRPAAPPPPEMVACNHAHPFGEDCNPECTHGAGCVGEHPTAETLAKMDWSQQWRPEEGTDHAPTHR